MLVVSAEARCSSCPPCSRACSSPERVGSRPGSVEADLRRVGVRAALGEAAPRHACAHAAAPQGSAPPAPGSYTGAAGRQLKLYVSGDSRHVEDVVLSTSLGCIGSPTVNDQLVIDEIAIAADGSFSATTSNTGVFARGPATFRGHVHGATLAGVTRLAGSLRETISYDDGTVHTCTTNKQPWSGHS